MELLAKSAENGNLTLYEHTAHVVSAIEKFAIALDFPVDTARKGAVLHDLGKAHPHFQNKIGGEQANSQAEQRMFEAACHRHELSSLGFLPLFPREDWDTLIELVVAHHKSVEADPGKRGLLDLVQNDREFFNFHLYNWEKWAPRALEVAQRFGFEIRAISPAEARTALDYAVRYCANGRKGWSPWKGLLRAADHFASAFGQEVDTILRRTFQPPKLDKFKADDRKSALFPLSLVDAEDPRPHTLVVAPTGAGKTDYLLRRCRGRVFYTLPFQASINAMFDRIKGAEQDDADVRLLHSTSRLKVHGDSVEQTLQPLVGASVKVLTPHQIASIVFGTAGFETVMLDLRGTDVILDEIHTYTSWSGAMVREIVRALIRLNCRVHIGTATIPTALYRDLLQIIGGSENVYEVRLNDAELAQFNRHIIYKEPNAHERVDEILAAAFDARERVLLIYNTVKQAQAAYAAWKMRFPEVNIMLIHSRFRRKDRVKLEKELINYYNNRQEEAFGRCLVISTQVVEVSLDISFDRMITACAPLDALIQRFGRVNRVRNEQTIGKYKPVHVLVPGDNTLPYEKAVVQASWEQLPDGGVLQEAEVQAKIDAVYPKVDIKSIESHLIYREGAYRIRALTHKPRSVIVDALEIESATCILESDRQAYEYGSWQERIALEIPVAWCTLRYSAKKYVQLDGIGSYPYVIPQSDAEHGELGLILHEPAKFL